MRQELVFTKGMKLFAGKAFRFAGKGYEIGAPFPYKTLAVTQRKLAVMIRVRKLTTEDELKARKERSSKVAVPVEEVTDDKKPSRRKRKKG